MYKRIFLMASAIIWILLPKCSVCLMAYMGLFSALGIGKLVHHTYLLPVIRGLLAINLGASLYLAIRERQYGYAAISCGCALVFVLNKLYFGSMLVDIIAGLALLAAALRIRVLRAGRKECLFAEGKEKTC